MPSAASAARCDGLEFSQGLRPDVAYEPIPARIAPRPAKRIVEEVERIVRLEFSDPLGFVGSPEPKRRRRANRSRDRRGIMGGYDSPREGHVRKVGPVSIGLRVRRIRTAGKRKLNGYLRKRAAVR